MHITQDETNCHWVKKCSFEVWKGTECMPFKVPFMLPLSYLYFTFHTPFSLLVPFQVPFIHLSVTGQFP